MAQQETPPAPLRLLDRCPQLDPLGLALIQPPPDLPQPGGSVFHAPGHHLLPGFIADPHGMLGVGPIHSQVVPCHPALLCVRPAKKLNGRLALYRSSLGPLSMEPSVPFSCRPGQSPVDPPQGSGVRGPLACKLLERSPN